MEISAGNFTAWVSEPYPCWVSITIGDSTIRFSHLELSDLSHIVSQCAKDARRKLPEKDRPEA